MIYTKQQYNEAKKEGDGICVVCKAISYAGAEPEAENVYCQECQNRGVIGITRAWMQGLIEITGESC